MGCRGSYCSERIGAAHGSDARSVDGDGSSGVGTGADSAICAIDVAVMQLDNCSDGAAALVGSFAGAGASPRRDADIEAAAEAEGNSDVDNSVLLT